MTYSLKKKKKNVNDFFNVAEFDNSAFGQLVIFFFVIIILGFFNEFNLT